MSIIDSANEAIKTVTGLVGTANGIVSKAGSLASASIESVVSSLPISSGSFSSITSAMQSVSSITNIVTQGTSQALSKVKQLVGGAGEALSNPIAFVTKTLKDTVDGFSSSKDLGGTVANSIKGYSAFKLSSVASRAGVDTISTASELSEAWVTISDNIYLGAYTATGIIQSTVEDAVYSTQGIADTIRDGIRNNMGLTATAVLGTADIVNKAVALATNNASLLVQGTVNTTTALINTASELIPAPMKDTIGYLDANIVTDQSKQLATRLQSNVAAIANEIDYVEGVADSYAKVMDLTTKDYPRFTDNTGTEVSGVTNRYSTLSQTEVKKLTNTIGKICPTVSMPSVTNYDEMKALYDTALNIACINGMASLIINMCETTLYFDERSKKVLMGHMVDIVKAGDILLYKTIVTIVGIGYIANPIGDLRIITANLIMNNINLNLFNELLLMFNISADQLISGNTYGTLTAINTDNVTLVSATDTKLSDMVVGADTRSMALQFKIAYS